MEHLRLRSVGLGVEEISTRLSQHLSNSSNFSHHYRNELKPQVLDGANTRFPLQALQCYSIAGMALAAPRLPSGTAERSTVKRDLYCQEREIGIYTPRQGTAGR